MNPRQIEYRVSQADPDAYAEVNSGLRHYVTAHTETGLRQRWLHLVRDGRDVARSMYARGTFPGMGFEDQCVMWQIEVDRMEALGLAVVRLEDLTQDPVAFAGLAREIGSPASEEALRAVWERSRQERRNATGEHVIGHWSEWAPEQTRTFWRICGEGMIRHGYA